MFGDRFARSVVRSRWAAVGAAVAVACGAGGVGWVAHATSVDSISSFVNIAPCRLFDTRAGGDTVGNRSTPLGTGETFERQVWGSNGACAIPSTATGISYNLTVPDPVVTGFVKLYPGDAAVPNASAINTSALFGTKANGGIVGLSATGSIKLFNQVGPLNAILDITGYFVGVTPGTAGANGTNGTNGTNGVDGIDGVNGTNGTNGTNGVDGVDGINGINGINGVTGAQYGRDITAVSTVVGGVGVPSPNDVSITVGADGFPVLAFLVPNDPLLPSNGELTIVKCVDPACSSPVLPVGTGFVGVLSHLTSITIGSDGNPIVAFSDIAGALKVTKCTTSNCISFGPDEILDVTAALDPAIAIGVDGNPIVSYYDSVTASLKVAHCADPDCISVDIPVTVDPAVADPTVDAGAFSSITIGVDGNPVISYYDFANGVKVVKCSDATCLTHRAPVTLDAAALGSTSIAIGIDANPVISYADINTQDLKIFHCVNQACSQPVPPVPPVTPVTLDADAVGVFTTSLAISADGNPYVSYTSNGVVTVIRCANTACTSAKAPLTVDLDGGVGSQAMAIGGDANPVIAYVDALATGDVRVAKLTHSSWTPYGWGR